MEDKPGQIGYYLLCKTFCVIQDEMLPNIPTPLYSLRFLSDFMLMVTTRTICLLPDQKRINCFCFFSPKKEWWPKHWCDSRSCSPIFAVVNTPECFSCCAEYRSKRNMEATETQHQLRYLSWPRTDIIKMHQNWQFWYSHVILNPPHVNTVSFLYG